jgi:hypothetical protein
VKDIITACFAPSGATGAALSARLRGELAQSLGTIAAGLGRSLPVLPPGRLSAAVYARYFDLLHAVIADDPEAAGLAFDAVEQVLLQPPPAFLRSWGDLASDEAALFDRHINVDPTTRVALEAPAPCSAGQARDAIGAALSLLESAAPELAAEIRALIGEIVLVAGGVNENSRFDGATAFACWGALFLNADEHGDRIEAVDGLAHESAHALLFGHTLGHPLVENGPDERHASPLRADPRPLDGIYHATFVSARMHHAHGRILASGLLSAEETARARDGLASSRAAFADGHATLQRHARMTPIGEKLMAEAAAAMAAA